MFNRDWCEFDIYGEGFDAVVLIASVKTWTCATVLLITFKWDIGGFYINGNMTNCSESWFWHSHQNYNECVQYLWILSV